MDKNYYSNKICFSRYRLRTGTQPAFYVKTKPIIKFWFRVSFDFGNNYHHVLFGSLEDIDWEQFFVLERAVLHIFADVVRNPVGTASFYDLESVEKNMARAITDAITYRYLNMCPTDFLPKWNAPTKEWRFYSAPKLIPAVKPEEQNPAK